MPGTARLVPKRCMASFYLRAVCQNRNLWGVEDFEEITIRHSKYAASRFAHEAAPALQNFANSSPVPFVNGIKAARKRIVARPLAQAGLAQSSPFLSMIFSDRTLS